MSVVVETEWDRTGFGLGPANNRTLGTLRGWQNSPGLRTWGHNLRWQQGDGKRDGLNRCLGIEIPQSSWMTKGGVTSEDRWGYQTEKRKYREIDGLMEMRVCVVACIFQGRRVRCLSHTHYIWQIESRNAWVGFWEHKRALTYWFRSYSPRDEFLQKDDKVQEENENSGVTKIEGEKKQWLSKIN